MIKDIQKEIDQDKKNIEEMMRNPIGRKCKECHYFDDTGNTGIMNCHLAASRYARKGNEPACKSFHERKIK